MDEIRKTTASLLKRLAPQLAEQATTFMYRRFPELEARYGAAG